MASSVELKLVLTADSSGLVGVLRTAAGELRTFVAASDSSGSQAGQAVQQTTAAVQQLGTAAVSAGAQVAEGMQVAESASRRLAESEEETTARIRAMVQASVAAREEFGGVEQSQRAVAERSSMTAEQIQALHNQLEASANSSERMRERVEALNAAEAKRAASATQATNSTRDERAELAKLLGQIDPTVASLGRLDEMERRLAAARRSGLLGADDYAAYASRINQARDALTGAGTAAGHFSFNTAAARREMGVLVGEIARGDFGALQGSLTTLANRAGLLSALFTPLGIGIGVVAAALIAIGAAAGIGETGFGRLNAQIVATGNYAGVTASGVLDMGSRIGESTGRVGAARDALASLVATGKLTGEQLEIAGRAAVDFSTVTGQSADEAAKALARIADDPLRAVTQLNEQYHFLDATTLQHIRTLEEQGRTTEAASAAFQAFGTAFAQRAADVTENLGSIERSWNAVRNAASTAWDRMLNIGRPDTVADLREQMSAAEQALAVAQANASRTRVTGVGFLDSMFSSAEQQRVQFAADQVEAIGKKLSASLAKEAQAASAAITAQEQAAAAAATGRLDALMERYDKTSAKQKELAKAAQDLYEIHRAGGQLPPGINFDGDAADAPQGPGWDALKAKILDTGKAAKQAARELLAESNAMDSLSNYADSLATRVGGPLDEAYAKFNQSLTRGNQLAEKALIAGAEWVDVEGELARVRANATAALDEANTKILAQNAALAKRNALTSGNTDLVDQLAQQRDRIAGVSSAQQQYNAGVRQANELAQQAIALGIDAATVQEGLADRLEKLAELRDSADVGAIIEQWADSDGFDKLVSEISRIENALDKATDPEQIEKLNRALGRSKQAALVFATDALGQGISSLQSMATEGTKAYAALETAQVALNLVTAIGAIANQGLGDPYTAFARIAAMAAMMAQLVDGIGSITGGSGPSSSSAEVRQQTQGTGTVLGDSTAKSESIARATEITANATEQLVGLNRGMLNALVAMQNALGAAGNQLARGAGDASFPGLHDADYGLLGPAGQFNPLLDFMTSDPIGSAIGGFLFGGDRKVIDQGILIAGGALQDMLNNIVVGAYRTIETDGGLFGSDDVSDQLSPVSEQFSRQFQLVIGSIIDTVREGALALGMLPEDVEAAIARFRVEEIRISLKGLSPEDQQKELEAVFSSLFDGLAGSVVPYIGQFQQVGEGLGETLVRVATEVQVVQEGFKQLGLAVDQSDPEKFAQISDGLVQASGGLDAFISGMQAFVANFASDEQKFRVASDALTSALDQVGLSVPGTRDGMWSLMQSLDATTEEGREQIATLLRLADVAGEYYDLLEQQAEELAAARTEYADFVADLLHQAGRLSDFDIDIDSITTWEDQATARAEELARAAGLQGAAESDLALIRTIATERTIAAIRKLRDEISDLSSQLGYVNAGSGGAANDALYDWGSTAVDQTNRVRDAQRQLYEAQLSGIQSIQDYLVSMQFGDLSGLTPEEQLAAARAQLEALQARALGGDADAMQQLPQMAQQFLQLLRGSQASGGDFNAGYDWVRMLLQSVVDRGPTVSDPGDADVGGGGISRNYLDERDQRLAQQDEVNRRELALQLTQHLGDLAKALNVPVLELAETMHVPLDRLATDLGINLQEITGASVEALANMAQQLGVPLGDLVQGLGRSLPDLRDGLTELTGQLGIDLTALTGSTAGQLADLAERLGTNLSTLATSLGVDLGKLTDIDSPIFVALRDNIDELSPGIRDELNPLLQAVADASSDEAKNEAVKALRDHVDELAPSIKNQLAPFFADIVPVDAADQLAYLRGTADSTASMARTLADARDKLGNIADFLRDANRAADVPGYATGTGYVPSTGLALLHEAEAVIPAPFAAWLRQNGFPLSGRASNDDPRLALALDGMRAEIAELRRENRDAQAKIAMLLDSGNAQDASQRSELIRAVQNQRTGRSF